MWPMSVTFHPGPSNHEQYCAMICSSLKSTHLPRDYSNGILAIYDIEGKKLIHSYTENMVSSTVLKYVCGGQRLLAADMDHDYPVYRHMLIFSADGLSLLQRVPVLPTCTVNNATLVYSTDFTKLSLLLIRKKQPISGQVSYWNSAEGSSNDDEADENGNYVTCHDEHEPRFEDTHTKQFQVAVYKVKMGHNDLTLSRLCCLKVCSLIGSRNPSQLPLPVPIIKMVKCHTYRL